MYNCEEYMRPIWEGNEVLHESFMPVNEREMKLLYHADKILSVMNAEQTIEFQEGKDYILRDGMLYIPETSGIKIMPWDEYNPQIQSEEKLTERGFTCTRGGYLRFGFNFHAIQYEVSYLHSDEWTGYKPVNERNMLPNGDFTFGFLGDSIATGGDSSKFCGLPPYAPVWAEMIAERLEELYGIKINYINKSVGGTASGWGNENVMESFKDTAPDLFVIAFGMNDASGKVDNFVFRDNCGSIADKILALNPDCRIIFVSTMMPNPLAGQFIGEHETHEGLLIELAGRYKNATVASVSSMHKYLLTKKNFYDMTGNNINHPNDFLARIYAQTILKSITNED
ncbi:MAG: SGNH/GDSL hydrolase family protein [Oscillospiraceae bacterium]|nr:SGNH/GDSL hydrolase family protein [Oscillospiraceae bacterium]